MTSEYELAEQNLALLTTGAIALIVAGIVIAFGSGIVDSIADDVAKCDTGYNYSPGNNTCSNETEFASISYNASRSGQEGLGALSEKLPSVGLIIGAVVIIGILVAGFRGLN